jgi:predicted DNA-binding WGR domain protein
MRRFEFKEGSSYKFWEIEVEGSSYTARYGKVGTEGQTQTKKFASPEKAAAEAEKKIREKTGKGYKEVAAAAAKPASAQPAGDDRAAEFAVRADQLQAAGDPWGQRIALSIALEATAPRSAERKKLAKELAALEKQHAVHFFGTALHELMQEDEFEKVARLTWEYGYIVKARIGSPEYDFQGPDAEAAVAAVMASPASEYLRELTIGLTDFEGGGLSGAHEAIAKGIVHPHLESMFIGEFTAEEQEISWVDHGDVSAWFDKAPNLRRLRLHGAGILFGDKLEHPKLERLEIETGGLPEAAVAAIAKAKLPELTHLEVWFGRTNYGGTTNIEALRPLFSNKTLPKLQHLGLQNSEMQDQIATELIGSKLLAAVSSVDMSMGTMREPGARAIIRNAEKFKHLKSLNLNRNYIPADLCTQLRTALGSIVNIGRQETPDVYDGEEYFYTAVGE